MIFWILIAVAAVIVVAVFVNTLLDDYVGGFLVAMGAAFISAAVGFLVLLAFCAIPANNDLVADDTHKLKALGNANATTGRFYFLGGGYIDGKRVLNFITERQGGAIRVEQADATNSTIYEGSTDATVQVRHYDHNNGWVLPWPIGSHTEYEFHIPSGSVVESYTLDNK